MVKQRVPTNQANLSGRSRAVFSFLNLLEAYHNPEEFIRILNTMKTDKVDFVAIGDSNLLNTRGFQRGFEKVLFDKGYPMHATTLMPTNENTSSTEINGYNYQRSTGIIGTVTGAPAGLEVFMDSGNADVQGYGYLGSGTIGTSSNKDFVAKKEKGGIDVSHEIRYDVHYGTFVTGGGTFRQNIRDEDNVTNELVAGSTIDSQTGANSMQVASLTLAADSSRNRSLECRPNKDTITSEIFFSYYRILDKTVTNGYAFNNMYPESGKSMRSTLAKMNAASDEFFAHYFGIIRNNQLESQNNAHVVILLHSGHNDETDSSASIGPKTVSASSLPAGFEDNHQGVINKVKAIWDANEWPQSELHFMIMPSPPVLTPTGTRDNLEKYRNVVSHLAYSNPQTFSVDIGKLITAQDLEDFEWGQSGLVHLQEDGYEEVSKRIFNVDLTNEK